MRIKVDGVSVFIALFFFAMLSDDLFSSLHITFLGLADEILAVISWIGVFFSLIKKKIIKKENVIFMISLCLMIFIGFAGNIVSTLNNNAIVLVTDAFIFSKPYIIFIFFTLYYKKNAKIALNYLAKISKVMIIVLSVSALFSQITNLSFIIGGKSFLFYSSYSGTVSWWTIMFIAIIWNNKKENKEKRFVLFLIMGGIIILFNRSGLGYITYGLGILMYILLERKNRIKWYHIAILLPSSIIIARDEIADYLLDSNSPRSLFLKYAFVTANKYFPFGSGFATYGSVLAISNYSQLYHLYGFDRIYGMTSDYHPYLMDNYYQQIIGQLGYFGALLLIVFIYNIVKKIISLKELKTRNAALLLYGCWIIAGIGFGTASSWGCTIYMVVSLFLAQNRSSDLRVVQ